MSLPLRSVRHHVEPTSPPSYSYSVVSEHNTHVNENGRLQLVIERHPGWSGLRFTAKTWFDNSRFGPPIECTTGTEALLRASAVATEFCLLNRSHQVKLAYAVDIQPSLVALAHRRRDLPGQVLLGAINTRPSRKSPNRWHGFCSNTDSGLWWQPRPDSFLALLDVVDYLIGQNIWP